MIYRWVAGALYLLRASGWAECRLMIMSTRGCGRPRWSRPVVSRGGFRLSLWGAGGRCVHPSPRDATALHQAAERLHLPPDESWKPGGPGPMREAELDEMEREAMEVMGHRPNIRHRRPRREEEYRWAAAVTDFTLARTVPMR